MNKTFSDEPNVIYSENSNPSNDEFQNLMNKLDLLLNEDAKKREDYYTQRNGVELEEDVERFLKVAAIGTEFENSIRRVSGSYFPDIVAHNYYGVEVKSTNKNHWQSIGSSILESTRISSVERIFLTFGKLGKPVEFKSRSYEECLSGISVTHYPRYQINMQLEKGQTIFDKMGIQYDELRKQENPVIKVAQYYKKELKPGQSLWWAGDNGIDEKSAPPVLRLWTSISPEEKMFYTIQGLSFFPEMFSSNPQIKYSRFALWLVTDCSIVNTHIRDSFSAGGHFDFSSVKDSNLKKYGIVPAVLGRVYKYRTNIQEIINTASEEDLLDHWRVKMISDNRVEQWCRCVASNTEDAVYYYTMLCDIFGI